MSNNKQQTELDPRQVVKVLEKLAQELTNLNPKQSAPSLSHYRSVPECVSQSYEIFQQGAALVHAASTKYTLLGKIDLSKANELISDILQGCQLVSTGCLAIFDNQTGCTRSARHHVRKAARAILLSVMSLIEAFDSAEALKGTVGAQKTGVVWDACNVVLEKKLPIGNRSAIRRDLLTFKLECSETINEFQDVLDLGPSNGTTDDTFESFLDGGTDQYSDSDLPVASACMNILKCSRGCLNVSLQAMEATTEDDDDLQFVNQLLDMVLAVGEGVTDFGSCMYPPINYEKLKFELTRQSEAIRGTIALIQSQEKLPSPVLDLSRKIGGALETRLQEATAAIDGSR